MKKKRAKLYTIHTVNIQESMSLAAYYWHEACIPVSWQGYFMSKSNNEVLKSTHLSLVNACELCSYKLWFKRLEASIWATKIQNDRNLQNVIKFTFTSCHFEMLNSSSFRTLNANLSCAWSLLLPTYIFFWILIIMPQSINFCYLS